MTSARRAPAVVDELHGMKAVQAVFRAHGLHVRRSTLWSWRTKLPDHRRLPVRTKIVDMRAVVVASRASIEKWILKMERDRFDGFRRSKDHRAAAERRKAILGTEANIVSPRTTVSSGTRAGRRT